MIPILVDEKYLDSLIQFHLQKQQEIRDHISTLQTEDKNLSATIMALRQAQSKGNPELSPRLADILYDPEWTWVKKIEFALEVGAKAMTSREIVDTIELYEPELKNQGRKPMASISAVLSTKAGDIFDKYSGEGETRYMKKAKLKNFLEEIKSEIKTYIQTPLIVEKGPDDLPF